MSAGPFLDALAPYGIELSPTSVEVLQVNITRLCNQQCVHCHVDASPRRTEAMSLELIEACIDALEANDEIETLDVTGGAPELHPHFEYLVSRARMLGRRVMVRHNLTVTLDPHPVTGRSMARLPALFARNGVEVVASLPCYTEANTDRQRGSGVFLGSIESLRRLNEVGYGVEGSGLVLDLAYNPGDESLPGDQVALEADYRARLLDEHGVVFTRLFALTNMPINRFKEHLIARNAYDAYMEKLHAACNPAAAPGVMCRAMVSVAWNGTLYDCDFNQMLDMAIGHERPLSITEFDLPSLKARRIRFAEHCFGCVAAAGSSCGGALSSRR
jgi:radical SAM/Cys-rich protein